MYDFFKYSLAIVFELMFLQRLHMETSRKTPAFLDFSFQAKHEQDASLEADDTKVHFCSLNLSYV